MEIPATEKIGNVTLNYRFYHGTDEYSDGDVEDRILQAVREKTDYEEEILLDGNNWAMLYHLSPIRENLLEWYDFGKGKTLLEIGAGCGAVTGLFCRKCDRVVAVDLSKKRSTINATRNKACGNLEIMVGNFEDIQIKEKFDYVTLIGVLEYSIYYINSPDPFADMLKKARSYLKPGGTLVFASCSSRVPADDFFNTILPRLRVRELLRTAHAPDHPAKFPESHYLKCLYAEKLP